MTTAAYIQGVADTVRAMRARREPLDCIVRTMFTNVPDTDRHAARYGWPITLRAIAAGIEQGTEQTYVEARDNSSTSAEVAARVHRRH